MTASTSAIIKLLLLATVAFAKDLDQDADSSSSRLRGKIKQVVPPSSSSSSRALVDGTNIALNQMKCVEYVPIDGSVVCTFRTIPPADMSSGKTNHACLSSQAMGGRSYCISTEVYRANFNDVPVYTDPMLPPPPTDSMPPAQEGGNPAMGGGIPPGTPTGTGIGKCPTTPQVTGMACAQYVSPGATAASCIVGNLQCDCALQDDIATTEGWNCYMAWPPMPPPTQPPITMVNADINNVAVSAPTDPPVRSTSEKNFPTIINPSDCPATKPNDGVVSCEKNRRCYYYERDSAGNPTAARSCDCNGDGMFQCRTALNPIFGQQSF